jgi:hypoxanthine phosphoribosyltransferase
VTRLAGEITSYYLPYVEKGETLLLAGILTGSVVFVSDLIRHIDLPLKVEFIRASSYGASTASSGEVQIQMLKTEDIFNGVHVLFVEDIVDSGNTIAALTHQTSGSKALSVRLCTLLDKPMRRQTPVHIDFTGTRIRNEFVVGYGLDYADHYRNLPFVGVLKPEIYG